MKLCFFSQSESGHRGLMQSPCVIPEITLVFNECMPPNVSYFHTHPFDVLLVHMHPYVCC